MKLYTVNIVCVSGPRCNATIVARDADQATELVKTQFHRHLQSFVQHDVDKMKLFHDVKVDVTETPKPTIIKLDWDIK